MLKYIRSTKKVAAAPTILLLIGKLICYMGDLMQWNAITNNNTHNESRNGKAEKLNSHTE